MDKYMYRYLDTCGIMVLQSNGGLCTMNRYGITINQHAEREERASSARTAVDRAMAKYVEGEFKPGATIKVRFLGKCHYHWDIIADTPFDYGENGKGHKRTTVELAIGTEGAATARALVLAAEHPDWHFVRAVKREVA